MLSIEVTWGFSADGWEDFCRIQDGFTYMSGGLTGMAARLGSAGTVDQNDFMRLLQYRGLRGRLLTRASVSVNKAESAWPFLTQFWRSHSITSVFSFGQSSHKPACTQRKET